ncbi:MAG: hypothetical protein U9R75_07900 [Candidatus Thermoplasmatota archaeon]|nr:hypothetical protein [Candidatus Thermoplasmatota archaeon]
MIKYLLLLYLGIISILLVDTNPLWATPLLLVAASFMWDNRWVGLIGIMLFSLLSLGRVDTATLTDLGHLSMLLMFVVIPEIILLELVISPKPYRFERISVFPLVISLMLAGGFALVIFVLTRFQRIGVYLNSDPTLQVFVLMALSIFFTGPILLGSRGERSTVSPGKRL